METMRRDRPKYAEFATFKIFMVNTGSWSMTFTKSFGEESRSEVNVMTFCTLAGNAGMRSHNSNNSGETLLTSGDYRKRMNLPAGNANLVS